MDYTGTMDKLPFVVDENVKVKAVLDDNDAAKAWRNRDRLHSSLLAIFPAAVIGKPVTVTLLDETRLTGRLCSCDGLMNLQLDSGVIIRNPNTDEFTLLDTITIFGQRVRYVTVPKIVDIPSTLTEWESKHQDNGIFIPRPVKSSKPLKENQIMKTTRQSFQSTNSLFNNVDENTPSLKKDDLENFASIGVKPSGDKKIDLIVAQTLKVLNDI
ncbi:unnamed protein product [Heterobilharzia americana]|nr:unnamed protein product [Heterobilharzia americana]